MNLLREYVLLSSQNDTLKDHRYITEVLGIQIPLHESYPFSVDLEARILHEHMLLEGFFDGLKKLKADALLFGQSVKEIISDPGRIGAFVGALYKNVIKRTLKPVRSFFKMIMEKLPAFIKDKFPTFIKAAEKVLGFIDKVVDKVMGMDGWKQAVAALALALGIKYIWKEIGELIEKGKEYLNDLIPMFDVIDAAGLNEDEESSSKLEKAKEAVGKFVEWFKEQIIGQVTEFIERKLKELAVDVVGGAVAGGVAQLWKKLTQLYGGAKFVMGTLAPAFKRFTRKGPTITTNESLVRECTRELLREKGELGKQVFAQSAPEGSRHAGDEPDTELEISLKRAIANHLFSGGASSKELGELGPYILRFMDDPDYNDVFIRYPAGEVCRGTRMSLEEARSLIPGFDDMPLESATGRTHAFQKFEAMTQKVSVPPFEYSPKSGNQVSSWSTDSDRVCTRFAKKNADLWGGNAGVILYAEASQNDFLDFIELYKFGKLSKHSKEKEVAAFGPVTVTAVKVYKEVTEEQWATVQTEVELGRPK